MNMQTLVDMKNYYESQLKIFKQQKAKYSIAFCEGALYVINKILDDNNRCFK